MSRRSSAGPSASTCGPADQACRARQNQRAAARTYWRNGLPVAGSRLPDLDVQRGEPMVRPSASPTLA